MLNKLVSSAVGGIGGGGTLAEIYADTTDAKTSCNESSNSATVTTDHSED